MGIGSALAMFAIARAGARETQGEKGTERGEDCRAVECDPVPLYHGCLPCPWSKQWIAMKQNSTNSDGPKTADTMGAGQVIEFKASPEEEKQVLRKLDLVLLPLMGVCYMMQYIDKLALNQATLLGLREDLGLHKAEYSWTASIFFFGYLVWSWPSSYLVVRLPLAKYISACVLIWAGALMCHAAAKNFGGIMAARFFLGVGEAAAGPGFTLIVSMFYKRDEQPSRQSAWFFGNCVASLIGGVLAYGIGNIKVYTITSWQLLFLFLGAITAVVALVMLVLLPDSIQKTVFLNKHERKVAEYRILKSKAGADETGVFKWDQAWIALRDPQTWLLVLFKFSTSICNAAITSFSGLIIQGFGFSVFQSLLMQMPIGAAQIVFLFLTCGIASFVPRTRILMMILNCSTAMLGLILVWKLDESNANGRLAGLALGSVVGVNLPLSLSLVASNVAGFTKRSVTSALLFITYCVANIVGPQFFLEREEPRYDTGMAASVGGLAASVVFLVCLMGYYIGENRRRDIKYGRREDMDEVEVMAETLSNKTDLKMRSFRYML